MTSPLFRRLLLPLLCLLALPAAAQYDLDEVCGLSMDEGRLIVELRPLPQFGGFGGGRGGGGFDVGGIRGTGQGRYRSLRLTVTITHSHGPAGAGGTLQLYSQPLGVKFTHSVQGEQSHEVYYEQLDNRQNATEDSFALLRVTFDRTSKKIEFRAPDLGTLCQEHPREASLYLGPIFRVLKRGHLFSVDPRFARQVLCEPPPMEELKPQVRTLVARLDSDSPRDRAGAASTLLELGLRANELLEALDRSTLTPQQHAEVEAILHNTYAPTTIQAQSLRNDAQFMVDCLYITDPKIRELAIDRLQRLSSKPLKIELPEDREDLAKAIEKARDGLSLRK